MEKELINLKKKAELEVEEIRHKHHIEEIMLEKNAKMEVQRIKSAEIKRTIDRQKEKEFMFYNTDKIELNEAYLQSINPAHLTGYDKKKVINKLEKEMSYQANSLNFEYAIKLRDKVIELKKY